MLTPCSPCVCAAASCNLCMFGHHTDHEKHNELKKLIIRVNNGEKPVGYGLAQRYMEFHPGWEKQMED